MPKRYYSALYDSAGNKRGRHHLENSPPSAIISTISHGIITASSGPSNVFTLLVVKVVGIENAGPIWDLLETYNLIVDPETDQVSLKALPKVEETPGEAPAPSNEF